MRVLLSIGLLSMAALLGNVPARACERTDEISAAQSQSVSETAAANALSQAQFDAKAAQEILRWINQSRAQAGVAPLALDDALNLAAQAHAQQMLQRGELSHQYPGEPDLTLRLAQSGAHFNHAGENVALDFSLQHAHQSLMTSDEHRRNLLDSSFNAVGIAVVWSRCQMYLVQDFAHQLPTLGAGQAEDLIAEKVATLRTQTRLPKLNRVKSATIPEICSSGKMKPARASYSNARYVLSYTNAEPQALPSSASNVIGNGQMRDFSVGACYARTEKNPNGAYFVTMMFY